MAHGRRIPHDIFKLVLSFKDPRYEKVRAPGEGFGKSPSRVWYTREERQADRSKYPYKKYMYEGSDHCSILVRTSTDFDDMKLYGRNCINAWFDRRLDKFAIYPDLWMYDPRWRTYAEMALEKIDWQCEACGPDLFVHDYRRVFTEKTNEAPVCYIPTHPVLPEPAL